MDSEITDYSQSDSLYSQVVDIFPFQGIGTSSPRGFTAMIKSAGAA